MKFLSGFCLLFLCFSQVLGNSPESFWNPKILYKDIQISPNEGSLYRRIKALENFPTMAEPIVFKMTEDPRTFLFQLSKDSFWKDFSNKSQSLQQQWILSNLLSKVQERKFQISPQDLEWLDLKKLSKSLQRETVVAFLEKTEWVFMRSSVKNTRFLMEHFQVSHDIIVQVDQWIEKNKNEEWIPMEMLLPLQSQKILHKYSYLRGRNCFATALQFQYPQVMVDESINLNEEPKHFKAMINSDEFLNMLWTDYYRLSDHIEPPFHLKYGDIVVFWEGNEKFGYKALKHAFVHLAGDLYFHKQSKSSTTPIEFVRWDDVYGTWKNFSQNLSWTVFRPLSALKKERLASEKSLQRIHWTNP